jgi:hypothetical protein
LPNLMPINILIIRYDFWTLTNVVIVDSTHLDMVQCASFTTMHVTTIVA